MYGDGVMVGANNTEFVGKRRFGKPTVGNKNDEEVEGEGKEGERGGDGLVMDDDFYQRNIL